MALLMLEGGGWPTKEGLCTLSVQLQWIQVSLKTLSEYFSPRTSAFRTFQGDLRILQHLRLRKVSGCSICTSASQIRRSTFFSSKNTSRSPKKKGIERNAPKYIRIGSGKVGESRGKSGKVGESRGKSGKVGESRGKSGESRGKSGKVGESRGTCLVKSLGFMIGFVDLEKPYAPVKFQTAGIETTGLRMWFAERCALEAQTCRFLVCSASLADHLSRTLLFPV